MVRSNPDKITGFLSNKRNMNVAITRAKRMCVLICDTGTVNYNPFLKDLTTYFKENGVSRTSFDYLGHYNKKVTSYAAKSKKEEDQDAAKRMEAEQKKREEVDLSQQERLTNKPKKQETLISIR